MSPLSPRHHAVEIDDLRMDRVQHQRIGEGLTGLLVALVDLSAMPRLIWACGMRVHAERRVAVGQGCVLLLKGQMYHAAIDLGGLLSRRASLGPPAPGWHLSDQTSRRTEILDAHFKKPCQLKGLTFLVQCT